MAQTEAGQIPGWIERARERMAVRGLTYDDLSEPLGISTRGGVSHYLNGRRELSAQQAVSLAEVLECTVEWLLTGKQVSQPSTRVSTSAKLPSPDAVAQMILELPPEIYAAVARLVSELAAAKVPVRQRRGSSRR